MATQVYKEGLPFDFAGVLQTAAEPGTYAASVVRVGKVAVVSASGTVYVKDASTVGAVIPANNTVAWNGVALTQGGAIYYTTSDTGSFASVSGFRVRNDGALLVSTSAPDDRKNGWGIIKASGAMCISSEV